MCILKQRISLYIQGLAKQMTQSKIKSFFLGPAVSYAVKNIFQNPQLAIALILALLFTFVYPKNKRPWLRILFERLVFIRHKDWLRLYWYLIRRLGSSKSMDFQDLVVLYLERYLPGDDFKSYLEIGAHDGLNKSNCYLLMEKSWSGICIEPNPVTFIECEKNRPTAKVINAAFSSKGSGLKLRYFWPENRESNGTVVLEHQIAVNPNSKFIDVDAVGIEVVAGFFPKKNIGYVSVDTEGGELDIVSYLLSDGSLKAAIFTVEHNFDELKKSALTHLMNTQGYAEVFHGLCRNDSIFIKKSLFPMSYFLANM
jgi:FkbM family methyltransferase